MISVIRLIILSMMAWSAWGEENFSPAQIGFTQSQPFSCRIFRHRVKERAKANDGLAKIMERLDSKKVWRTADFDLLAAYLQRAGFDPKSYHEKEIAVTISWDLSDQPNWLTLLNSAQPIPIVFQFRDLMWADEMGIMPLDYLSQWQGAQNRLVLSFNISPLQLCYGEQNLILQLTNPSDVSVLALTSKVDWL